MKKNYILALCLGLLLILTGCGSNKENSVETIDGLKTASEQVLHVNTEVKSGTIAVSVEDENGNNLYDEEVTDSGAFAVNAVSDASYTVKLEKKDAVGKVNIYTTDSEGNVINSFYGQKK